MAKIKDIAKVDRPRERLLRYGKQKLSDAELLAIVLGSGIKGVNVVQLARKILTKVKKTELDTLTLEQLTDIKGLGNAKAMQILAALEFGRRQFASEPHVIMNIKKVCELCADIRTARKEHFVVFYLDSRSALITREVISIGTLNASLIHPREVFEPALRHGAVAIIVAHNHPSGDPTPSREDYEVTARLKDAATLLGIHFLNHIILTKNRHVIVYKKP